MPLGDFPGRWGWGYDGVLPFAPESRYGRPAALKSFVQACHARGLAVFLDVVYNHFGPDGNYLGLYAPQFFSARHSTPWGRAINFDGDESRWVRAFFRENALYWLDEFRLDGLRLDAVHAIHDESAVHIVDEPISVVVNAIDRIERIGPDICSKLRMIEIDPLVYDADVDSAAPDGSVRPSLACLAPELIGRRRRVAVQVYSLVRCACANCTTQRTILWTRAG